MGQFLHISLVTELKLDKSQADKYKLSLEDIKQNMQKNAFPNLDLYQSIDPENYHWKLKEEILENGLLKFLKDFYPQYYKNDVKMYQSVLQDLESKTAKEILEKAENKGEEAFQLASYGYFYLSFPEKDFRPEISGHYEAITLALEGKIMMETYGRMFDFYTESLQLRFQKHNIAKTLLIQIQ